MPKKRPKAKPAKLSPAEQHRRFKELARDLGLPETEAAEARVFGKVGLGKSPKRKKPAESKR